MTEFSSSPGKAKAGLAGFKMRFSSGRGVGIRYMVESDALLLRHTVGHADVGSEPWVCGRVAASCGRS